MAQGRRTAALPVRKHRANPLVHRWRRPRPARSRTFPLPAPGHLGRMGRAAGHPARTPATPAAVTHTRPARLPDCRRHWAGAIACEKQTARPDPHGHRRGQDLHRHHCRLSAAEVRRGQTHPVPGRYPQPRQTGASGVHGLHAAGRRPHLHRAVQRAAPVLQPHRPTRAGLHQYHPAHVFHPHQYRTGRGQRRHLPRRCRPRPARRTACAIQPVRAGRGVRLHRHRRMPPQHLQPEAGAGLLRRLPDRPHRHPGQAHLRLLQPERGGRIQLRAIRARWRQRRLRRV